MNITFLIGNGFDINLGLQTKYLDFCKHYIGIISEEEQIKKFKDDIEKNIEEWSYFESTLGEYTGNLSSVDDYLIIHRDVIRELKDFLSAKKSISIDYRSLKERFFTDLILPERRLTLRDRKEIENFKKSWTNFQIKLNIVSFNYTDTIEKFIGDGLSTVEGVNFQLYPIKHVHGSLDGNMTVGVNDIDQIENKEFRKSVKIKQVLVKPDYNRRLGHLIDVECDNIIEKSNIMCLFGLSLGDTDKRWWEQVGRTLLNSSHSILIIFEKGEEIDPNMKFDSFDKEDLVKDKFIQKSGLTKLNADQLESVKKKIYVGYNTDLFKVNEN